MSMSTWTHAFKAVLWGFLGVRKHSEYEADTQRLKPQHVLAVGILAAVVFVFVLLGIVKLVT